MKKSYTVLAAAIILIILTGIPCFIKQIIGFPCPGCGMTRAYLALLRLDYTEAFSMHPLFFLPLLIPFVLIIKNSRLKNIFLYAIVAVFITVYIYRMAVYFPHTEPMSYNENCIIRDLCN